MQNQDKMIKIVLPVILILAVIVLITVSIVEVSNMGKNVKPLSANREIPAIDLATPKTYETATFALGCFWGAESKFGSLDGVIRTRVGYAGGTAANPTYYEIGDHSESVQLDYDPTVISYEELLQVFWQSHDPLVQPYSGQYASLILYHNDKQRVSAEISRQLEQKKHLQEISTRISPIVTFYLAEGYHQKYILQQTFVVMGEFKTIYPDLRDFVNSTAATRINGYLGGNGKLETIQKNLDSFGLSAEASQYLLKRSAINAGTCNYVT